MKPRAILTLAALSIPVGGVAADGPPTDPAPSRAEAPAGSLDARFRDLESMNRAILERLDRSERDRRAADERYRSLESKYEELRDRLERQDGRNADEGSPATDLEPLLGSEGFRDSPSDHDESTGDQADEASDRPTFPELPLRAAFGEEGVALRSFDDEYQLRFRILDQTDFKLFSPGDQIPASSGLYIPRVRIYFEGRLTRLFDYEVSIQRSVEGVWDLLDGNVDVNIDPRFRIRFGRTLVPYSYDWYDHLEQYFITPERSLFPLNFGLSRSAGLMAHGLLFDDRMEYAVGGFDGHLTGLADENTTRDAVSYLNFKPFLKTERFPLLRDFNFGFSGYLGEQVVPQRPLPLRTSLQSSENDEAARRATSLFLDFEEDAYLSGDHSAIAAHLAWYVGGMSFEAEWQGSRDHYTRSGMPFRLFSVPATGSHITLAYFLTGEKVRDRSRVDPLRPFDPTRNSWGPGAVELFARFSELRLSDEVFRAGLADREKWTNGLALTDIGLNWYLTSYLKIYLDWQRSYYDSPVELNPHLHSRINDLFWIRGQLYY
ncbi:porin [Planctomyces sp. SH-PL62]|uniref:porin n=1 Tax=Planctomyces sp. SH-PL62 TaxID=1636152 RepID=UPI00078C952D|nr:porin [Planctomyces sp. SH-PL62]AMV38604.1 Phosphate-selective porin O and P [Planctomyces sp. SH-PL62]